MADHDTAVHNTGESVPTRWNVQSPDSNMWMNWDNDPRNTGIELEGERATLIGYLRSYRLIMEMKCADLDAEQLARRSVPPSTMSLLGLIRHMADVERHWFRRVMAGEAAPAHYWSSEEDDADWAGAVADAAVVAAAWQDWRDEVSFAERFVADADDLGVRATMRDGTTVALREVILHMIEEYARHAGHADLLRERIDGRVGQLFSGGTPPVPPGCPRGQGLRKSPSARTRGAQRFPVRSGKRCGIAPGTPTRAGCGPRLRTRAAGARALRAEGAIEPKGRPP
jgi:uncharacterized damage-inducible protein DinB